MGGKKGKEDSGTDQKGVDGGKLEMDKRTGRGTREKGEVNGMSEKRGKRGIH